MKLLWCITFAFVFIVADAISELDVLKEEWDAFKKEFEKVYEEIEDNFRMKIFIENKFKVAHHNKLYHSGKKSFKLAMNKYSDMLNHEFVKLMNGFKRNYNESKAEGGSTFLTPSNIKLPDSVNWTEEGYVTEVKDQGNCGSCWSFSATGALEGQHFRKTSKLVSLSEQNLIDCSGKYGNEGCNGGLMDQAFQYVKENHGIDTEQSYKYKHKQGRCHYKKQDKGATDTGYVDVKNNDETALMEAVATVGPVSVAIDASHESFQLYKTGVYDEDECSSTELDHGVLVTGYGTSEDGKDYWIVKNSWGPKWGENGYIRMARNKNNQCGIASQASYPLV